MVCMLIVQLRLALLAIVLVRALTLFHDADAPTVLPNAAAITLDEQPARVVALGVNTVERLAQRRARILLVAANAARYILLFGVGVIHIVIFFCSAIFFGRMRALAATGWLAHVFAGRRRRCG